MKLKNFTLLALISFCSFASQAQNEQYYNIENLKYYNSSIRDNIEAMRSYTDSIKITSLLQKLDSINNLLSNELDIMALNVTPIVDEAEVMEETNSEEAMGEEKIENLEGEYDWSNDNNDDDDSGEYNDSNNPLKKYLPFGSKIKTKFVIQFGINSLYNNQPELQNNIYPTISTGRSWFWDFSLIRTNRIGGSSSKFAFNYGISFLKNRFSLSNDVALSVDANNNPIFSNETLLRDNPKINVGYLNIPLGFSVAVFKKTKLSISGNIGYRIHTVQKLNYRIDETKIDTQRYGDFALNNWTYGASFGIDIDGFDIIGRYQFSKLFKDNPTYDYNIFMIGTSIGLF